MIDTVMITSLLLFLFLVNSMVVHEAEVLVDWEMNIMRMNCRENEFLFT